MQRAKVPWCLQMQEFIHRRNIENYRKQLAGSDLDEGQRKYLTQLLADEMAKESPPRPANEVD